MIYVYGHCSEHTESMERKSSNPIINFNKITSINSFNLISKEVIQIFVLIQFSNAVRMKCRDACMECINLGKARFPLGEFFRATRSENKNPAT